MMRNHNKESPMIEHQEEAHPGEPVRFSMEVIRKMKRPLDRKVLEGTLISESTPGSLINRKGEWGQNLPPKFGLLETESGSYGLKKRKSREEQELDKEKELTESDVRRRKRQRRELPAAADEAPMQELSEAYPITTAIISSVTPMPTYLA